MGKYIIAGGSGFIGKHISSILSQAGHQINILTTRKEQVVLSNSSIQYIFWDPKKNYIDENFKIIDGKLINLAGAGVADKRWSTARKKEILESRISSLQTLYHAIEKKQIQITHLVSASAIGYYGEGDKIFTEKDSSDESFLSSTCRQWEEAAWQFAQLNIPVAIARVGIVMGKEGGALKEFIKPLRFGIAGIPSDGKQIYSWIHIEDISRLFIYLSDQNKEGIFNAVAPNPTSINQIFSALIKHTKPFFIKLHAPSFILKIMLGEMSIEVLKSAIVSSKKIEDDGFKFKFSEIEACIENLMTS
ncbi:MAG TPA: TIGR01777 family oxidoreductase [Chitinophagaceae bacterium]|nr:TIGR01777 family oxidoreductase [Chitinophagaceae bacterium]